MDFSFSAIIAGFIFGVIGLWVFREGKRKVSYTVISLGLALMIFPYFVTDGAKTWIFGLLLCGATKLLWDAE